jgi:hypothetical protein
MNDRRQMVAQNGLVAVRQNSRGYPMSEQTTPAASAPGTDDAPRVLQEILAGDALSMAQAARTFPPYRLNKPTSPSTVWRWIAVGVRLPDKSLLKLEAARIGGRWLTSKAALARFIQAQTPQPASPAGRQERRPRTGGQRRAASEKAGRELERLGI